MGALPEIRVEVAFDSGVRTPAASRTWTDVSDYVELDQGVTITGGRSDERAVCEANTLALILDNTDGRFTPERAASPYYPNVKLGRPIRLQVNHLRSTTGNAGTFDTDVSGWSSSFCTIARVATPTRTGAGAMSMTTTTAGGIFAFVNGSNTAVDPVLAGEPYVAEVYILRAGVTARDAHVSITWYDAAGVTVGFDNDGADFSLTTTYQRVFVEATAPPTAATARMTVVIDAAALSEVFYVDDAALLSNRFLGFVDEWPVEWTDGTGATAYATVTATSRLALLGEGSELASVIEEEYGRNSPIAHYALSEAEGATQAADSSLTTAPALKRAGSGAEIVFGSATGPGTDGLSAATFAGGKYLKRDMPTFGASHAVACFFNTTADGSLIQASGSLSGAYLAVEPSGKVSGMGGLLSPLTYDDGLTHHAAWVGTAIAATLYVDGVAVDAVAGAGIPSGKLEVGQGYTGVIAHVGLFDSAVTADNIARHSDAGLNGFAGESVNDRINRYGSYVGLVAADIFSAVGDVALSHIDTTGKTALDLLRIVEATDGGVLFDGRDGRLIYHGRASRYQATSAFTIDAAAQQLDGGMRPILDRSTILNDVTGKNLAGTLSARVLNQASIDDNGRKSAEVEVATDDEDEPFQAAAMRVNRYAEPRARVPSLSPVDVLTLDVAMRAKVLAADVDTRFTVTGQPSQSSTSSADYFIEGYTDTIALESWQRSFNVSPAALFDVWLLGSATKSQLDTTTILG